MIVYRIATAIWIDDLSGTGAKLFGGRWNSIGFPVIYTSENISLCMLEILMSASRERLRETLKVAKILLPKNASILTLTTTDLPDKWQTYPHIASTQRTGDEWLRARKHLLLKVPSAANILESNVLINPFHKDFEKVKFESNREVFFNHRLTVPTKDNT